MPVKKDAFIVKKLREAGAISEYRFPTVLRIESQGADESIHSYSSTVLAKANMSELADYKSAHAGPGWSAVGGQTINVYVSLDEYLVRRGGLADNPILMECRPPMLRLEPVRVGMVLPSRLVSVPLQSALKQVSHYCTPDPARPRP
jgi:hypothetical protein